MSRVGIAAGQRGAVDDDRRQRRSAPAPQPSAESWSFPTPTGPSARRSRRAPPRARRHGVSGARRATGTARAPRAPRHRPRDRGRRPLTEPWTGDRGPSSVDRGRPSVMPTPPSTAPRAVGPDAPEGSDIARYRPAHSSPGMTQLPMLVAKICVCLVSSTTVITETSDESLSSATKSLVIGASASRKACGPRTSRRICCSLKAQNARGLELSARHGLERAAIDFALVGGVVEAQADEGGDERRQPHDRRQPVVDHEQLQQHRRPAHDLDIERERAARQTRRRRRGRPQSARRSRPPSASPGTTARA